MSWDDRATMRRLMGLNTLPSLKESRETASADQIPVASSIRELAGLGESKYSSWTLPKVSEEEEFAPSRIKARRLITMFENAGLGGTLLPDLGEVTDFLMNEAAKSAIHADVAKHHIKAVQASKVASGEKHANADVAHTAHKNASQLHRNAAQMMHQAGDHETAAKHDAWANHHDAHAQHFKAMKATMRSAEHSPKDSPAPKTQASPHNADIHARPKGDRSGVPTEPHGSPASAKHTKASPTLASPKHAPTQAAPSHDPEASVSTKASGVVSKKASDDSDAHEHHTKAARFHMANAIKHFRSGNHEGAQKSFNAALRNAGKAKQHAAKKAKETLKSASSKKSDVYSKPTMQVHTSPFDHFPT